MLFIATALYVAVSCMHINVIWKYVWACASRCEHIILPISSTTIFTVLIKTIWCMPYASIAWLCSDATYNIEAINITVSSKSLNPTLHISPPILVGNALGLKSMCRWFEPVVNHYFSSNSVHLLASRSLQGRPTVRMTEAWRIKLGILVGDKILCMLFFIVKVQI